MHSITLTSGFVGWGDGLDEGLAVDLELESDDNGDDGAAPSSSQTLFT